MSKYRRSLLFTPGDSQRKISKAAQIDVDSIILDLEDSVAVSNKVDARRIVVEALRNTSFGRSEILVRINAPKTDLHTDDLRETSMAQPDGYVVPKVEEPDQIQTISRMLDNVESRFGWPQGSIRLLPIIETAKGILNIDAIAQSDERLSALLLGAEDLVLDIGAKRSPNARSIVVMTAAAYELQAIDTVFVDLDDDPALKTECNLARQLGFDGKLSIHPRQVAIIQNTFTPSQSEIELAHELVQAFAKHTSDGVGVFQLDGKMVDVPVVRAAERLLAQVTETSALD